MFFTSGGYTAEAMIFADAVGLPLLKYDAEAGVLVGVHTHGETLVLDGFDEAEATTADASERA